jgi:hypothetical protein
MKFKVYLREVHIAEYEIEAPNERIAKLKVLGGDGELISTEYSHTEDGDNAIKSVSKV